MPSRDSPTFQDALCGWAFDGYYLDDDDRQDNRARNRPIFPCFNFQGFAEGLNVDPRSARERSGGMHSTSHTELNTASWHQNSEQDLPPFVWLTVPNKTSFDDAKNADSTGNHEQRNGLRLDGTEEVDRRGRRNGWSSGRRSRSMGKESTKSESRLGRRSPKRRGRSKSRARAGSTPSRTRSSHAQHHGERFFTSTERDRSFNSRAGNRSLSSRGRVHSINSRQWRDRSVHSRSSMANGRDYSPYHDERRDYEIDDYRDDDNREDDLQMHAAEDWDAAYDSDYPKSSNKSYKSSGWSVAASTIKSNKSNKSGTNKRWGRRGREPMDHAEFQRRRRSRSSARHRREAWD